MTEEKKLRHLMRGVKQELFAGLVRNPPHSLAEFRTEATTIEKALQQRAHHYNRDVTSAPADILSAGPGSNTEALRELVRSIVKEELRKLQLPEATPTVSTLAAVIRDEVRHAILQPGREEPPVHHDQPPPVRRVPTQTLKKAWVRKALEKEQRELQPSSDPTTTTDTAETRTSHAPTKETRKVRSETRSRSRRKFRTRSKSRSRSREASVRLPEKRPPSPSSQQPYKKALQTNAPAKVTLVPSGMQRTPEKKTAMEAPRERHLSLQLGVIAGKKENKKRNGATQGLRDRQLRWSRKSCT
ncbi:uncharacterized protein LOC142570352 [Dermacentor variabilis]|uniref:uncharacterized protein LOC142570352 n=1 Tax=Dermacentor variabilis TaxID=34621 RepID=UPI003F5C2852